MKFKDLDLSLPYEVATGYVLHLPEQYDRDQGVWLRPGGVLDLTDRFVLDAVTPQLYKLRPVAPDAKPAALPRELVRARDRFNGIIEKTITRAEAAVAKGEARAEAAGIDDGIPVPDAVRKKK